MRTTYKHDDFTLENVSDIKDNEAFNNSNFVCMYVIFKEDLRTVFLNVMEFAFIY
jgi:hypothetical protein